jgi:cytidine deaminase
MVTNGEHRIRKIVAVSGSGAIMPPCGRCRELMYQIDKRNLDAEIIIGKGKSARLRDLLPNPW